MSVESFVYDLIICSLVYIIILQFLSSFFESRNIRWHIKISSICIAVLALALTNQLHKYYLNFIVNLIFTFVLCFLLYIPKSAQGFGISFFAVALAGSIELVTLPIVSVILKERTSIVSNNSEFQFIYSIFNQIALFIIFQIITRMFAKQKYLNGKSTFLLVLPSASIIAGLVFVYLDGQQHAQNTIANLLVAFACIGLLLTNIIVFYVYDKSLERYNWEAKYNLMENSNQAQLEYYSRLDEHLQDIKVERHDFKSNLQIMLEMLDDNPEKVADYIKTVHNRISNNGSLIEINVQNPALSAILQAKHDVCKKFGISFDYIFKYDDLSFLSVSDTCAIFANALNNAVEACNRITDTSIKKYINLRVIRHNNMIIIKIKNSRTNELKKSDTGYATSKSNADRHGFGIISIQRAANRYGGEVVFNVDENSFTVIMQLNIL